MISEAPNQCYTESEYEPTFAEFCKELTRRHREYLQAKVRKDGDEYVVFCRMFNFVNKVPTTEWHDSFSRPSKWKYPNIDGFFKSLTDLANVYISPLGRISLRFKSLYDACNVAKALVDYFQPFGTICDMYDEAMNIVFSLEKASFVVFYEYKRYNLLDVKRGVLLHPKSLSTNSKEYFDELLTILRNNAIFPSDDIVKHK